jgi:uncharacterized protein YndB with AHSA1/START domain
MTRTKETRRITMERTYESSIEDVWDLWATKEGIESWWGPEGFTTEVLKLDLQPGGELRYAMTATGPDQVAFMKSAGMPLTTPGLITYTDVAALKRIGYIHVADFIPDIEAYNVSTLVEFHTDGKHVRMVLTFDPMHDEMWTERAVMGHESQLRKFERILATKSS